MPQAIHPTRAQPVCIDCLHAHKPTMGSLYCTHPSAPIDAVYGDAARPCDKHRSDLPPVTGTPPRCGPAGIYFEAKSDRPAP